MMHETPTDFFMTHNALERLVGTDQAPILYDVCRPQRYAEHARILPTARWRDHLDVDNWCREIPAGQPVVVNCVHGHNVSQLAVAALRQKGLHAQVLAGGIEGWIAAGGVTILKDALPNRDELKPSRWVTRTGPDIGRLACHWLIRRFVDRQAEFYFVEPEYVRDVADELGGIAFDVPGVDFTHHGQACTFDTLIEAFGIDDPALAYLQFIVRGADTADLAMVPETAGLLAATRGISAVSGGDDHRAVTRGMYVYDAFYAWRRHASDETHNWPVAAS